MVKEAEIIDIIKKVKKEVQKYENPIVTEIGEVTRNPFQVLVSCILSLRTRDETTAKASSRLFALASKPETMIRLSTKQIEKAIYPVGFYKTKARRIKGICKVLLEKYNGKVPDNFDELMKLKGVGRKTANIVMCYGFHKKGYIAVDTHVHRIPNRLGWVKTKKPEQTEEALKELLPRKYWKDFNDIFVTFGQNVCKPVGPKCNSCPVSKNCEYYRKVYLKKMRKKVK